MMVDFELSCPNCDSEIWSSDATEFSRNEFEWDCPCCGDRCRWYMNSYDL